LCVLGGMFLGPQGAAWPGVVMAVAGIALVLTGLEIAWLRH